MWTPVGNRLINLARCPVIKKKGNTLIYHEDKYPSYVVDGEEVQIISEELQAKWDASADVDRELSDVIAKFITLKCYHYRGILVNLELLINVQRVGNLILFTSLRDQPAYAIRYGDEAEATTEYSSIVTSLTGMSLEEFMKTGLSSNVKIK